MTAALEPVVGRCYLCKDGVRRWVVMRHKPGSGYSLTWDTVDPRSSDYWGGDSSGLSLFTRAREGKAGNMGWKSFARQAIEDVTPNS